VEEFFALVNALFKSRVYRIVQDMENTSYLSSGGLSVIVDAYKKAEKAGGGLAIARASDMVSDLFEAVQIVKIIPFYPTVEEALRAV
jgi:anti-anti-sigma factor